MDIYNKIIADADMAGDITGTDVMLVGYHNATFTLRWQDNASPVGTLYAQASENGVDWNDLELTSAMVHDLSADAVLNAGAIDLDGTAAGGCWVSMENLPSHLRWFWDSTSGGSGDDLVITMGATGRV